MAAVNEFRLCITFCLVFVNAAADFTRTSVNDFVLSEMKDRLDKMDANIYSVVKENQQLREDLKEVKKENLNLRKALEEKSNAVSDILGRIEGLESRTDHNTVTGSTARRRFVLEAEESPIAFSAYVSSYRVNLGLRQTVRFDRTLINDGNAYNNHTGVFTCPETGVYLVSFFISDKHVNQVLVQLTIDNVGVSDAAAESIQDRHIDQGGNVVIQRLIKGQSMWVEVKSHNGSKIESSEGYRLATFSAVKLY